MNQNGRWVPRRDSRTSNMGNSPTGRQSGPKVSVVKYVERSNLMPSPLYCGRLTVSMLWEVWGEMMEEAKAIL